MNLVEVVSDTIRKNHSQMAVYNLAVVAAMIGAANAKDVPDYARDLENLGLLENRSDMNAFRARPTFHGWQKFDELKRTRVESHFAFFARKFENAELDAVFAECLKPAVLQTGFELRTVPRKAGLIDAIIEQEIRTCKFLMVDLTDDNAGAYWEAGFAEGLGKPVIYICKDKVQTHFDTEHRQTIRWGADTVDETGEKLKAVIRNTLLGEAKQQD